MAASETRLFDADVDAIWVCLVSASYELQAAVQQQCGSDYVVYILPVAELSNVSSDQLDRIFSRVSVVLFDWNSETAGILPELRRLINPFMLPLFALCSTTAADHVAALFMGADGILVWPLQPVILEAYLIAHRRLAAGLPTSGDGIMATCNLSDSGIAVNLPDRHEIYTAGPLKLDRTARRFFVLDQEVKLTPREYDLMAFLIHHAGSCQTRNQILDDVLKIDFDTGTNILDVHIYELRKKLRIFGFDKMIQTVRGVGFRFVVPEVDDEVHISNV